jgi:hypothetical protein
VNELLVRSWSRLPLSVFQEKQLCGVFQDSCGGREHRQSAMGKDLILIRMAWER